MENIEQRLEEIERQYPHLVEQAKQQRDAKSPEWLTDLQTNYKWLIDPITKVGNFFLDLLIARSNKFHGKAYVTRGLEADSRTTAAVVTGSHLLDLPANLLLTFYGFKDFGNPIALIASTGFSLLILRFSNDTAIAVAGYKPGKKAWSNIAMAGLIGIHIVEALVAGVSIELFNNQPVLSNQKAAEVIEQKVQRLELLKTSASNNPKYLAVQKQCQEGEQELNRMPRSNPRWDSLYVRLYGSWAEQNKDWSEEPMNKIPLCKQEVVIREESLRRYEQTKAELDEKLALRTHIGSDLLVLKQQFPDDYHYYFTPSGELKSGVEASRLAINNFFGKMVKLDFAGLGFSLFFFSIAAISSAISCGLTIAIARTEENQKSKNQAVENVRDKVLASWQSDLNIHHQQELERLQQQQGSTAGLNGHHKATSNQNP